MNWFKTGKRWKLPLLAILLAVIFFGFVKLIEEESLEVVIPQAGRETIATGSQMAEILKELAGPTAPTTDWTKKIAVVLAVPFTPQAPKAEWSDPRQEAACEEASVLMAMKWVKGETLTTDEALTDILAMADWESKTYGSFVNTNAPDTVSRLFKGYFKYDKATAVKLIGSQQIIDELLKGNLVLMPANGRKLGNPYYKQPGPLTHMLVIRGYDKGTDEFITNDPGTKRGEKYRYPTAKVIEAAWNYPTGDNEPVETSDKSIIIVSH